MSNTTKSLPDRYYDGRLQIRPRAGERLIAIILSEEKLYGDGLPRWRQGKSRKWCKSSAEADADRKRLIKVLRRHAHIHEDHVEVLKVAERLESCRPETRCHSGACPCCTRAFQRWLVIAGTRLLKQSAKQGEVIKIVSVIPTRAPQPKGKAKKKAKGNVVTSRPKNACIRYARACRRSNINFSFGAIDFSFNEYATDTQRGRFTSGQLIAHIWVFANAREIEAGRSTLRSSFRKNSKVPRPVKTYLYDGNRQAIAYAFKGDFSRREQITAMFDSDGKTISRRNTRIRPLRAAQKVELSILLNRLGLYDRLILRDIEFEETPAGTRLKHRKT